MRFSSEDIFAKGIKEIKFYSSTDETFAKLPSYLQQKKGKFKLKSIMRYQQLSLYLKLGTLEANYNY